MTFMTNTLINSFFRNPSLMTHTSHIIFQFTSSASHHRTLIATLIAVYPTVSLTIIMSTDKVTAEAVKEEIVGKLVTPAGNACPLGVRLAW